MDNRRAKEILRLYRPWTSDASEPEVREALEHAARDVELKQWLEQHCLNQCDIRENLKKIPVPSGLRGRILEQTPGIGRVIWWRQPAYYIPAAAAACLLALAIIWWGGGSSERDSFAGYRKRMVQKVQRMYNMDMVTSNLTEIRQYLADNQGHADYVVPKPMRELSGVGCAVLKWRNKKVSLVCLREPTKSDLYLFVIDRSEVADPPSGKQPEFRAVGQLMSASWSKGDKAYVLAGEESTLHRLLPATYFD